MRLCGINTGTEFHLLDHIAPLSYLMKMPLIVTEEINFRLAKKYYPQVETIYEPDLEFKLSWLGENFDVLFECRYWRPHLKTLFKSLFEKSIRLVFCPHGQSDKGFSHPTLDPYKDQDVVLLYGDLMIDMLKKLEIFPHLQSSAITGNYRAFFFEKYRDFYADLLEKELPIDRKKKTILYAPTWKDSDRATSFFRYGKQLIASLPDQFNFIVRVHPLLEQRDPEKYYTVAEAVEKKDNAFLVGEFPPVYPMLSRVDTYLGDASSVGYDFLSFKKPIYLFPGNFLLHSCAKTVDPSRDIFTQIDFENRFERQQKELDQRAFGTFSLEKMRENILKSVS